MSKSIDEAIVDPRAAALKTGNLPDPAVGVGAVDRAGQPPAARQVDAHREQRLPGLREDLRQTGGSRRIEIPSDAINLDFVLGNKVMVGTVNANREHFEEGVRDLAIAEAQFPGWLDRLLTHPIHGLEEWAKAFELLGAPGTIKVFIEVAQSD